MLTKESLQDILAEGHQIDDDAFVAHPIENMRRTIFLMAQVLSEHGNSPIKSTEIQNRIIEDLKGRGNDPTEEKIFNPVSWFLASSTLSHWQFDVVSDHKKVSLF